MGPRAVRWALGARCLPTVGSHLETSPLVSDMTYGIPSDRLLRPRPCTGSPIVITNSVVLERLSRPSGAQPSNLWTVTGSVPFWSRFSDARGVSLGNSLGLGKVAGRAPKPLHGARGRSGVPLAFCVTLAHPFCSEGGVEHATLLVVRFLATVLPERERVWRGNFQKTVKKRRFGT